MNAQRKSEKQRTIWLGIFAEHSNWALVIALVAVWQLLTGTGLVINPAVPSPFAVATSLYHGIFTGQHLLVLAVAETIGRLLLGYLIAVICGIGLGVIAGRHNDLAAALNPIVALWIPLPAIITIPVISLWLGAGNAVIVLTVIFSAWIPIYLGALNGARSIGIRQLWVARSYGASSWTEVRKVIMPGAVVHMAPSLRVGMGYGWRAVIAAEIIVPYGKGLGITIYAARQFFDVPTMYAGVMLIALLGLALDHFLFPALERATIIRWGLAS